MWNIFKRCFATQNQNWANYSKISKWAKKGKIALFLHQELKILNSGNVPLEFFWICSIFLPYSMNIYLHSEILNFHLMGVFLKPSNIKNFGYIFYCNQIHICKSFKCFFKVLPVEPRTFQFRNWVLDISGNFNIRIQIMKEVELATLVIR